MNQAYNRKILNLRRRTSNNEYEGQKDEESDYEYQKSEYEGKSNNTTTERIYLTVDEQNEIKKIKNIDYVYILQYTGIIDGEIHMNVVTKKMDCIESDSRPLIEFRKEQCQDHNMTEVQ